MRNLIIITTVSFLTACSYGNNTPGATAAGAAIGGLTGAVLFHGSTQPIAIVGSAIAGGIVGNVMGKKMDEKENEIIYYTEPNEIIITREPLLRRIHCKHVTETIYREYKPPIHYVKTFCLMSDGYWYQMEK